MRTTPSLLPLAFSLIACSTELGRRPDTGGVDAPSIDAPAPDQVDAPVSPDAIGPVSEDALVRDAFAPDASAPDASAPDAFTPSPPLCITSSLLDDASITAAGFSRRGGVFRDGGWAVDASCDRQLQTLPGEWGRGSIEFEARDLLRVIPHDAAAHGCERFVLNLNRSGAEPDHVRIVLANMASDCAGMSRGNMRALMSGGPCCLDGPRMPDASDGEWHRFRLEWTGSRLRYEIDGVEVRSGGYSEGYTPGLEPQLMFGSECARGDETHAVFRNLRVCRNP